MEAKHSHSAYLSMGGNIGDREATIRQALSLLEAQEGIKIGSVSSLYETEPVGYQEQDWFLNIALEIKTTLDPYGLLDCCNHIEQELKRERRIRWGPRTIDIDILLYDTIQLEDEKLTIPHPRMKERAFVIIPLMEIAPEITIEGAPIANIAEHLKGEQIRRKP